MKVKDIISRKNIYPVFQPVVSLQTGEVYGYEAFTRIEKNVFHGTPLDLFKKAEEEGCVWDLDKLCRKTAIKMAKRLGLKKKLFININPESIYEKDFKEGFTKKQLNKYFVDMHTVVLEISEAFPLKNETMLSEIADYYRRQTYRIAVDGIGRAYSGLKRVCEINPEFIKIDKDIIRGIETDSIKREMVKSLVEFCKSVGSKLVAKGVETKTQLETLLSLGVCLGQGFYLGKPDRLFTKTETEAYSCIAMFRKNEAAQQDTTPPAISGEHNKKDAKAAKAKNNPGGGKPKNTEQKKQGKEFSTASTKSRAIEELCTPGTVFSPGTKITDVLEFFRQNQKCTLITVTGENGEALGIIPRSTLLNLFGTRYGFSLHSKKLAADMMTTEFLKINADEAVEKAAAKATARDEKNIYDPIIVEKDGRYGGIVTIKDLLDSIVNVEVMERTREISLKNRILQQQKLQNDRDMKMAELVQKSFYPAKAPKTDKWECAFLFKPMASVSGDVYDFYYTKQGEFCGAALFDVSGHGVASGLVGILSKYLAEQIFARSTQRKLDESLEKFNAVLSKAKGMVENYLTGVVLKIKKNEIEYVNAGHTDVLLKRNTSRSSSSVSVLGGEKGNYRGTFLGIPEIYGGAKTVTEKLEGETYILLYSDCLIESRNLAGDEMGVERLKDIFKRAPGGSAQKTLDFIKDIFDAYTEAVPLRDDLTVIVLKYTG